MAISCIHFEGVKPSSLAHNMRQMELDYTFKEFSHLNKSYGNFKPHSELNQELKNIVKEKTGRAAQAKSHMLLEGVFLFEPHHSDEDLIKCVKGFAKKFKVKVKELHVHRDEGHYEKHTGVWKPNLHAHVVIENINRNTGKSLRWTKEQLRSLQDYFAESLEMERGQRSDKRHLKPLEYKIKAKEEELIDLGVNTDLSLKTQKNAIYGEIAEDFFKMKARQKIEDFEEFYEFKKKHELNKKFEEISEKEFKLKTSFSTAQKGPKKRH